MLFVASDPRPDLEGEEVEAVPQAFDAHERVSRRGFVLAEAEDALFDRVLRVVERATDADVPRKQPS